MMKRRSLFWYIFLPLFIVASAAVFVAVCLPLWLALLVVLLLIPLISFWIYQKIFLPLKEIHHGIERFSRGALDVKIPLSGSSEIFNFIQECNRMAEGLNETLLNLTERRNELEALLSSMSEAVIAVDREERILTMNRAAIELFKVDPFWIEGKMLQEQIRNAEFLRFVRKTLAEVGMTEGEIPIYQDQGERVLQAHGTHLRDAQEKEIGALVVLNDVTRIRRLENLRKEFVANVSHELRTPVTAIKGFLETLQEKAVGSSPEIQEFAAIASKHTDRLHALIEDLLQLSKIERESETRAIETGRGRLRPVLEDAMAACASQAERRKVTVYLECPETLEVDVNASLLERAVINLLDNAIQYSESGEKVVMRVESIPKEVLIHVIDQGKGIPEEHLARIFERFYRVDKSRSRELGGTGLGLAIVKHIAQAHGGSVTVASAIGKGSTFTLHLPQF
jgi:two-component system phosphate regulon sensor histidine kinase PhoR